MGRAALRLLLTLDLPSGDNVAVIRYGAAVGRLRRPHLHEALAGPVAALSEAGWVLGWRPVRRRLNQTRNVAATRAVLWAGALAGAGVRDSARSESVYVLRAGLQTGDWVGGGDGSTVEAAARPGRRRPTRGLCRRQGGPPLYARSAAQENLGFRHRDALAGGGNCFEVANPRDELERELLTVLPVPSAQQFRRVCDRRVVARVGPLCGLPAIGVGTTRDLADRAAAMAMVAAVAQRGAFHQRPAACLQAVLDVLTIRHPLSYPDRAEAEAAAPGNALAGRPQACRC